MAFLAPYMLWGALAAAIPIALHFFFRSRYRRVPWAAMKFLLTSVEQTSRRLRFQELLLLLARVAVLVLLALALARPSSFAGKGPGQGDAVDAVLVVDTSYSMDARDGPATRLDRARSAARAVLDHLPPHSTAQVIACSDRAAFLGPRSASDLDQARQLIDSVQVDHLATDFLPGVAEAAAALERGHSPNREVYLFSDMQKLGWEQQSAALSARLREVSRKASVYLVRCGARTPENVAVAGIVPQSGIPHTGERAGFAVLVRNSGTAPVRNLTVSLTVDGRSGERETQPVAELGPGETRAVPLTAPLKHSGLRVLSASLKQDELEADNHFDQVIRVRDQVRILVVDGSPPAHEPDKAASFYLMHALMPVKDADKPGYHVQPRLVTPRQAYPSLLADRDLCILVDVPLTPGTEHAESLRREFVDQLAGFVREGHGLVIFGGDRVSPEAYNRILGKQHQLLPLRILASPQQGGSPVHPDRNSAAGSFSILTTQDYYQGLNGVEVRRSLDVEEPVSKGEKKGEEKNGPEKEEAQVLLRYTDGKPALVTRQVGAGEVMLVTTSADLSWSDWPLGRGMYVPFVDLALNHLLHGQTQRHNQTAGQPLTWNPPEKEAGRSFALLRPDGSRVPLGLPDVVEGRALVSAADTPRAGVYRIVGADAPSAPQPGATAPEGEADEVQGVPFAVTPDLRESEDLEAPTDGQLDERLGFKPVHLTAGDDLGVFAGTERSSREWTLWALAGVLALALVETVLAWVCGRAW